MKASLQQQQVFCLENISTTIGLTLDVLSLSGMWSWLNPIITIAYWGKKQFTVPTHI